jgi:hypothetical protein
MYLPFDLILLIQSLLDGKDWVNSISVSKYWYKGYSKEIRQRKKKEWRKIVFKRRDQELFQKTGAHVFPNDPLNKCLFIFGPSIENKVPSHYQSFSTFFR